MSFYNQANPVWINDANGTPILLGSSSGGASLSVVPSSSGFAVSSAQLPASLGQKNNSLSISVIPSTSATFTVANNQYASKLWDNVNSGTTSNVSSAHPLTGSNLNITGNVGGATTLTLQLSPDGTSYYTTGNTVVAGGAGDFHGAFGNLGCAFARIESSASQTITLWASSR